MVKFVLTIIFGWAGFYRFCKGQIIRGLLYLFTFGLFYIGWLIDIICALRDMVAASRAQAVYPPRQPAYFQPAVQQAAVPAPAPTAAYELKQYKKLLDSGAITEEEYRRKKTKLLEPDSVAHLFVSCSYCGTRNTRDSANCFACGAKLDIK